MAGVKYIASCSFGKDSLAMVLKIMEKGMPLDEVIFFDTGMEFDSIYHNRDKVRILLGKKGVKFTELRSKNHFLYDMFVRPVRYRDQKDKPYPYHYGYGWCGARGIRWGTSGKLSAIKKHYKEEYPNEQITEYVGIAYGEPERIQSISDKEDIKKTYPLVEWRMTEKDCLNYCYSQGWDWNENGIELYGVLDRVSCWCCQNKNLKELRNIYQFLPEYWQRLRGLQSRIDIPMKGNGKSVFQLEERFQKELKDDK